MAPNKRLKPNNIDIPHDLFFDILLKLQIKPLYRFKSVSKDWLAMINKVLRVRVPNEPRKLVVPSTSERFPRTFYTLDVQSSDKFVEIKGFSKSNRYLHIIGSCNGLLLLRPKYIPGYKTAFYLWNPLTGKNRLIPTPDDGTKARIIEGLSYDSITDEFKLVVAIEYNESFPYPYNNQTYVFSTSNSVSSRSSWNRVGNCFEYGKHLDHQAVVLNGSPHWIVTRECVAHAIVYFDPHSETFVELPNPDTGSSLKTCRLTVLGENLCCVNYIGYYYANDFEIWVFKESSWSKLFVMTSWPCGNFVHAFMPLCTVVNGGEESQALALYGQKEKISELPRLCNLHDTVYYVETLACPFKNPPILA